MDIWDGALEVVIDRLKKEGLLDPDQPDERLFTEGTSPGAPRRLSAPMPRMWPRPTCRSAPAAPQSAGSGSPGRRSSSTLWRRRHGSMGRMG